MKVVSIAALAASSRGGSFNARQKASNAGASAFDIAGRCPLN
jgi:hypothetical protein